MNLRTKNLKFVLLASVFFALFLPTFFPFFHLPYFAPFLVIACYQRPLITCLWFSLLCGLLIDLLSDGNRLGFYAMNYSLTILILYPQRKNLFSDSLTTLPLMVFFFSFFSTFLEISFLYSMGKLPFLSWRWVVTDLLLLPVLDGLSAFIVFVLPSILFGTSLRKSSDYF